MYTRTFIIMVLATACAKKPVSHPEPVEEHQSLEQWMQEVVGMRLEVVDICIFDEDLSALTFNDHIRYGMNRSGICYLTQSVQIQGVEHSVACVVDQPCVLLPEGEEYISDHRRCCDLGPRPPQ